jgi:hypothetical protein
MFIRIGTENTFRSHINGIYDICKKSKVIKCTNTDCLLCPQDICNFYVTYIHIANICAHVRVFKNNIILISGIKNIDDCDLVLAHLNSQNQN